jgi:Trp operon repressor
MIVDLLLTRSTRRSVIIKVKLLFNGSTSQRMEKEHLTKLALAS